jgi:hypothetical protein
VIRAGDGFLADETGVEQLAGYGDSNRIQCGKLAFVAVGALLGVKILRRNAKHIVTLNANTMKNRLSRRRRFVFCAVCLRLRWFGCHNQILAYRRHRSIHAVRALHASGIPGGGSRIFEGRKRSQLTVVRPFVRRLKTLLEYQALIAPVPAGRTRME